MVFRPILSCVVALFHRAWSLAAGTIPYAQGGRGGRDGSAEVFFFFVGCILSLDVVDLCCAL